MEKTILFSLIVLLFACGQSNKNPENNKAPTDEKITTDIKDKSEEINSNNTSIRSLFTLSPLSIFDKTSVGMSASEKETLLQKGKSESWEIINEANTKLIIKGLESDVVKLYFLKNKNDSNGLLAVETTNGKTSNVQLWNYSEKNKKIEKGDDLKKFSANDFVSQENKLPNSYQPQLHYEFINNQKIEVSLYTWMDKEFGDREVINKIFLEWNGESFEEKIVNSKQVKFNVLNKSNHDLSKLNYDGKILHKRFWNDLNGENITLFTQKGNELFVYHYSIDSDNAKLLRKVYDFEKECEFDLTLEFIENSIGVTDLDNNNVGEITFAYKKGCISDVSPLDLKMLMLENGNKYIIRGRTVINMGTEKVGGDKNIDASFEMAPTSFLSHANSVWNNINS